MLKCIIPIIKEVENSQKSSYLPIIYMSLGIYKDTFFMVGEAGTDNLENHDENNFRNLFSSRKTIQSQKLKETILNEVKLKR